MKFAPEQTLCERRQPQCPLYRHEKEIEKCVKVKMGYSL